MSSNAMFDTMRSLWTKQYACWEDLPDENKEAYSQYMINRFLSSCDYLLPLLSDMSSRRLTDQEHYELLLSAVRKMYHKVNYDAYKKEAEDKLLMFAMQKEWEIGLREARMYAPDLSGCQIDALKDKWHDCYKYTVEEK